MSKCIDVNRLELKPNESFKNEAILLVTTRTAGLY